jgi:hypothetical protein
MSGLQQIGQVSASIGGTISRVLFVAVAISAITGNAYLLTQILAASASKSDDGDAGSWSLTLPLFNALQAGLPPPQPIVEYASVASPMDLMALYAIRLPLKSQQSANTLGPVGSTPGNINISGLTYSDIATIVALGSATCIMIGMVDSIEETPVEMSDSPEPTLQLDGRDLTKVFYVNDTLVPEASSASSVNTTLQNPVTLAVSKTYSGTRLLLDVLDLCVAKKLSVATKIPNVGVPAVTQVAAQKFGYPWRNFIRTDNKTKLADGFESYTLAEYPPFQFQDASTWANVEELRNAPSCRLFVDEIGNLLFDDTLTAWTTAAPNAVPLGPDDIIMFRCRISDEDLVTYFQITPMASYVASIPMALVTGDGAALGFGQGIAKGYIAQNAPAGNSPFTTYGYRRGTFGSYWDVTRAAAFSKMGVLSLLHNSLEHATVALRGTTAYRVGDRVLVPVTTSRTSTTNAIWYIEAISNSWSMGGAWTTTLSLRFPNGGY